MSRNKLIIAAAGSGKTTLIVNEALTISNKNILITTFTEANRDEIRKKIIDKTRGYIPKNITVQTWFSFLLQHGVRPYQGIMDNNLHSRKIGFLLFEGKSGIRFKDKKGKPYYWGEKDFYKYYFTSELKIFSDKIAQFVCKCNNKCHNEVIKRFTRIYPYIFIDEVQDLAGWDLELLKLLFESISEIFMVGDPRQATYTTNDSSKHIKYRNGKIKDFIESECKKDICIIDSDTLKISHRNNKSICDFSSKLYPEFPKTEPCDCQICRKYNPDHQGIFVIKEKDVPDYIEKYKPITILRYQKSLYPELN